MAGPEKSARRDGGDATLAENADPSPAPGTSDADAAAVGDADADADDETKPETSPAAVEGDAALDANTDAATTSPESASQPAHSFFKKTRILVLRGLRSVSFWTIFGIITTFFFTLPSAWPSWCSLLGGCNGSDNPPPLPVRRLDPALAMVCLEFTEHPIVRQSGQCAEVSLSDLESLDLKAGNVRSREETFEDFAIVREIPRTQVAYSEARKWPPCSVGPWIQWPVMPTDVPGQPGAEWYGIKSGHHFKEWATRVRESYIPITHYLLVREDETWQFQRAAVFFSSRSIFDSWDGYLFSLASVSQDSDCLDCLHAAVPLVSLKHPYNVTLKRKDVDNPLLEMEAMDCEEFYYWGTNQQWRMQCLWPEVYQNWGRLKDGGYFDADPALTFGEMARVVRDNGWKWKMRPYV